MAALRPSTSGQVFDSEHTDLSDSDIDVSDLINHSAQNLSDLVNRDAEVFPGWGQGPAIQGNSNDSVSQNDNRQILQQLSNLGDRLAVIEGSNRPRPYKKTSDAKQIKTSNKVRCSKAAVTQSSPSYQQGEIGVGLASNQIPIPDKLRQEAYIQKEVQARLLHLADRAKAGTEKIKSQRGGFVDVFVSKRVKWPHEYVLAGRPKTGFHITNSLPSNGWLASAEVSRRNLIARLEKIC